MLNENARLWVAALRSGRYRRTTGMLHRAKGGYCCLGVACEVYIQSGGKLEKKRYPGGQVSYAGEGGILPPVVVKWLGLRIASGAYAETSLDKVNDTRGMTFKRIADIIESEPEGLFAPPPAGGPQ